MTKYSILVSLTILTVISYVCGIPPSSEVAATPEGQSLERR
jgi:hypothetical protein